MPQELFQAVQQAEESADQIMQAAQQKARELIKTTEDKIKSDEREASLAHRTQYQNLMEQKRAAVAKRIEEQRPQVLKSQQKVLDAAGDKLDQVSAMIFERIWDDGYH